MELSPQIEERLKSLPAQPGVYIMRDERGDIIYIGKAKVLKNRVRQYFHNTKNQMPKVRSMVNHIADLEYIITDNEMEALILECNLIKKYRPKYNISLKDDKSYPYIKITMNEDYPRVFVTRKVSHDGARYFGPYSSAYATRETVNILRRMHPVRTCNINIEERMGKVRECLYYYIGECKAPCTGRISKEEHRKMCEEICEFLDGHQDRLIAILQEKMENHVKNLEFEKAVELRDQIESIKKISYGQKVLKTQEKDMDVIGYYLSEGDLCIQVFFVREGKLVDREHFFFSRIDEENIKETMAQFVEQFYSNISHVPAEVVIQDEIDEKELIQDWLSGKRGSKVKLTVPKRAEKKDFVNMVTKNARDMLENYRDRLKNEMQSSCEALKELMEYLDLSDKPYRIEAYDISNIQGTNSVASMIVFENGQPKNSDYRRFKIKTVSGPNDYSSMREVIERRFVHSIEEAEKLKSEGIDPEEGKFTSLPDLIMVDGGRGHVNACEQVLNAVGFDIPVCGMVKDDRHKTRGLIYNNREIHIPINSNAFRLITAIQNEAHRFAINYHRDLRQKQAVKSLLDEIPGVGKTRRKELLKYFGSAEAVGKASIEELKKVPSMNAKAAEQVYNYFRGMK
ncbi:MAG: excinuclease ABC subunit UvrC [Thermoanaerobacteraceae bacterium]|nr:excinuclease ABC subunit UvrC [Thermoanaerobacteraceae bacterium]